LRAAGLVLAASFLAAAAVADPAMPDFAPGGAVALARIVDGDTLALADGRMLRLVGIDAPDAARGGEADIAARARAALAHLVSGTKLTLGYAGNPVDRQGRVLAELFAGGIWVQRALVADGLARVHGQADDRQGLAALLAAEDRARAARRGLWRLGRFAVRDAKDAARDAGTWQIVEGTVVDVAHVAGVTHVNFGADWRTAFSLRIDRDALKLCRAAGLDPRALKGARVRVRGFIDGRRRPTIAITFPEEIERL
jgi:endonuclease YncB( thermonuclease family)